jgi:hypothetical protein
MPQTPYHSAPLTLSNVIHFLLDYIKTAKKLLQNELHLKKL